MLLMHLVRWLDNTLPSSSMVPQPPMKLRVWISCKTLGILGNKGIPLTEREQKVRKLLAETLQLGSVLDGLGR